MPRKPRHALFSIWFVLTVGALAHVFTISPFCSYAHTADVDEDLTDMGFLLSRIKQIEHRLDKLEQVRTSQLPVLEVRSRENCQPCNVFRNELAAMKEPPFTVRYLSQAEWPVSGVPSFRYQDASGRQKTRTGYRSGDLQKIITEMKTN